MNIFNLSDKAQLDLLKIDYLQALASYRSSHSEDALDRLDFAKDAYVLFKLDNPTIL